MNLSYVDRWAVPIAGIIGIVAFAVLYSVLNDRPPGRLPKQEPQPALIRPCPLINDMPSGDCLYRPDGTIEAYRSHGGWIRVE